MRGMELEEEEEIAAEEGTATGESADPTTAGLFFSASLMGKK